LLFEHWVEHRIDFVFDVLYDQRFAFFHAESKEEVFELGVVDCCDTVGWINGAFFVKLFPNPTLSLKLWVNKEGIS
jgi:hypothetical protein